MMNAIKTFFMGVFGRNTAKRMFSENDVIKAEIERKKLQIQKENLEIQQRQNRLIEDELSHRETIQSMRHRDEQWRVLNGEDEDEEYDTEDFNPEQMLMEFFQKFIMQKVQPNSSASVQPTAAPSLKSQIPKEYLEQFIAMPKTEQIAHLKKYAPNIPEDKIEQTIKELCS